MISRLIIFINRFFKKSQSVAKMDTDIAQYNLEKGRRLFRKYSQLVALENRTVLDVGCGDGGVSRAFSEWCSVTGIDLVNRIDKKTGRPYWTNGEKAKFVLGDATAMPFEDGTFDVTMSNASMEHFQEPEKVIEEMKRVTKDGGKVIISFIPFLHPKGSHLYRYIFIPWCHVIFPTRSLLRAYKELSGIDYPWESNLNKMTVKKFLGIVESCGLKVYRMELAPLTRKLRILTRLPYIREFFTNRLTAVLEKES
jgi:ubiquinone/menaquinone biosynthesis C-methylase UbiE